MTNNRTLLVVDCHNIFAEGSKGYPGKIVNYTNLLKDYKEVHGLDIMQRVAFNKQPEGALLSFATLLRRLGFTLHFGQTNYATQMALRVADAICNRTVDTLVVGTNAPEAEHLLRFARDYGVRTFVFGFNMPKTFDTLADVFELTEANMQDKKSKKNAKLNLRGDLPIIPNGETAKPMDLCTSIVS